MEYKPKIAPYKKKVVDNFAKLLTDYPIIGAVNMQNLPAPQLQTIRAKLREKGVVLSMTKKRLLNFAFENASKNKEGLDKLVPHLKGMPAVLFAKENPFTLFKIIKKNKSPAPAKAGQIAPDDIKIPAGPTAFMPGPIIGELGSFGIKTKVENGKIAVLQDTVVCKEGEEISPKLAGLLSRFGINPMKIGLDLVAIYEDGDILTKKVLDIDEDVFMADLTRCAQWAFNLSVESAYVTEENKELLIQKAFNDAKALAMSQDILCSETVKPMLAKAEAQMKSLQSTAKIEVVPKSTKEKVKEENKDESKEKTKEEKDTTDKDVEKMVKKTKDFEEKKIPSADDLVKNS